MRKQILIIFSNTVVIYFSTFIFSNIESKSYVAILGMGIVLWALNALLRPVLKLLTLPVNLITFGIFGLVVNTWMLLLADKFIDGINYPNFWVAFLTALIISMANSLIKKKKDD